MGFMKNIIIAVALAFSFRWLYFRCLSLGVGVRHINHRPGPCHIIPGVLCGSEKIVATDDGLAFATSGYRELTACNKSTLIGQIFAFDLKRPLNSLRSLNIISNSLDLKTFTPHGMDLFDAKENGVIKLYVVTHIGHAESVEVFSYKPAAPDVLKHIDSIKDDHFKFLNDIVVVNDGSFYVTNMVSAWHQTFKVFSMIEFMFQLHTADVVFYDKVHGGRVVSSDINLCNGIALSHDKRLLFVTSSGNTSVIVYNRNPETNDLIFKAAHDCGYPIDNLVYDKESHFLYGAFSKHVIDLITVETAGPIASSSVIQIKPKSPAWDIVEVTEVFHDDGSFISSASTGFHYQKKLFIGTVSHRLAYCDVIYPTEM